MPPLIRPPSKQSFTLPARRATLAAETDVLVVGGGPAGLGAAWGAAEAGAQVILAERYGFLGGNATAALVMPLTSFHTEQPRLTPKGNVSFVPADHGPGKPVIAGVLKKFIDRLISLGGAVPPSNETGTTTPFDPEIFRGAALDLLDEAGVHFLFHAFASGVIQSPRLEGVVFETKSGPLAIKAKCIIDGTGDGDIAAWAGAPFEMGRDPDHLVQPMTLMFRMGQFEKAAFTAYVKKHPDQWRGVHGLWDLIRTAAERGELNLSREDILFFATPHPAEVSINSTRINNVLGTDVWDLTMAEWKGRRQIRQLTAFFKAYVPGFEKSYMIQSGTQVGVRETRRITGEYQLTGKDILGARKFDDVIARCTYPIDIHNPEGPGTVLKHLPPGEAYDIPLRCLLPQKVEYLLVAGRCISGTHEAHSSCRVMPASMATGQAAGVCAALSVRRRKPPRDIPYQDVQKELLAQGADLRGIKPGLVHR